MGGKRGAGHEWGTDEFDGRYSERSSICGPVRDGTGPKRMAFHDCLCRSWHGNSVKNYDMVTLQKFVLCKLKVFMSFNYDTNTYFKVS